MTIFDDSGCKDRAVYGHVRSWSKTNYETSNSSVHTKKLNSPALTKSCIDADLSPIMQINKPKITLANMDDAIAVIPYLLGFEPEESLVVVVINGSNVVLTARVDLAEILVLGISELKKMLDVNFAGAQYIIAAYSDDDQAGLDALSFAADGLEQGRIWDAVIVSAKRYRSIYCLDEGCCPSQGKKYPPPDSPAVAEAVGAGLTKLASRQQLESLIAAPIGQKLQQSRQLVSQQALKLQGCTIEDETQQVSFLLNQPSLDKEQLVELGLLVHNVTARNRALFSLTADKAARQGQLWREVARELPPEISVPAICLAGFCAWLCGDGAMMLICYEQAKKIEPDYLMLGLLLEIYEQACPPSMWKQLNPLIA